MSNSKLYALTGIFGDKEWDFIVKALVSPAFGNNREEVRRRLLTFAQHIRKHAPELADSPKSKHIEQQIWKALYPDKPYNDGRMRQEKTALLQAIEQIIPHIILQNLPTLQAVWELRYYAELLPLHPYFEAKLNEYQQQIPQWTESSLYDTEYYNHKLQVEEAIAVYYTQQPNHTDNFNLNQTAAALNTYFIAQQLRFALYLINLNQQAQLPLQALPFLPHLMAYIAENESRYSQELTIWTRYQTLLLLSDTNASIAQIEQHLPLLQKSLMYFPAQEKNNLYVYATNYVISRLNADTNLENIKHYWKFLYNIYISVGIAQHLALRPKGYIVSDSLRNILVAALNAHDTPHERARISAELETFLQTIEGKILGETPDQVYFKAALAILLFLKQQYNDCSRSLYLNPLPTNPFWVLDLSRLMIKAYYELKNDNQLESEINNFKTGLYRNSIKHCPINEPLKEANLNFVKLLGKILQPSTAKNPKRIQEIRTDLITLSTADKKWLFDKLMELT